MNCLRGCFLIASRHLSDANFARTVVLMLDHTENGAIGLVLNRPTAKPIREVWQAVQKASCSNDGFLSVGGPVEGPLMCLHASPQHSDAEIVEDVHLATQKEHIEQLIASNPDPLKVFAGYAGWGAGQLEIEMECGGWLVLPATAELVFSVPVDELWHQALRLTGRQFYRDALRLKDFPEDASQN